MDTHKNIDGWNNSITKELTYLPTYLHIYINIYYILYIYIYKNLKKCETLPTTINVPELVTLAKCFLYT